MNIDRSKSDFQRVQATGPVGRAAAGGRASRAGAAGIPRLSRMLLVRCRSGAAGAADLGDLSAQEPGRRGLIKQGAQPVGVARAITGDINVTLNALGTVTPLATATVRPQVGGMLIKLNFTEGQMVKAGDTLAQIDPRPYQAALDQARASWRATAPPSPMPRSIWRAIRRCWRRTRSPSSRWRRRPRWCNPREGIVVADQANVETAAHQSGLYQHRLAGRRPRRPASGGYRQYRAGGPDHRHRGGDPASAHVGALHHSRRQYRARSWRGCGSGAVLPVDAWDRSQTNKIASGTLAAVDTVVDPTTGSVKLRAMFDNTDNKLFPSQFVNIRLLVDTLHNQTVVPVAAIQRGADGTFVFVVTPDKTVTQRSVKTGRAGRRQDRRSCPASSPATRWWWTAPTGCATAPMSRFPIRPSKDRRALGCRADDAARAARARQGRRRRSHKSCSDDIDKLCPAARPGSRECASACSRTATRLSADCSKALSQMRRGRWRRRTPWRRRWRRAVSHPRRAGPSADGANISAPFIQRPVATSLLMIAILLVGSVGLSIPAAVGAAGSGLSHHPGADLPARRQSRCDDHLGHRAPGKAVRPDAGPEGDVVRLLGRLLGHHPAVRSQPSPGHRRAGSAGGDQCLQQPAAAACCRRRRSMPRSIRPTRR